LREFGHRSAEYAQSMENGIERVAAMAQPGDAIITLGAGSVSQAGDRILEALRAREGVKG
jgi:UDP-N-acetylmuramate--alanine ligase